MSKKSLTAKDVFVLTALAFIAYLIFLVISVVRYYSNISVRAQLTPLLSLSPQLAKERRHVNGSAYVFLALGAQANSMSCAGAVESLVRYGGWSGDVYLITDRPSCFDREQIVSAAEMEDDRLHIIAVHGAFSSGGFDPAQEVRFRRARLLSLTMKTRIFELIDNKSIEVLAFVDCDVIVGVEGCPAEFIASGPQFPEYSVKFSRMYFADESGLVLPILKTQEECIKEGASFVDVHSGTFVVHRRHSEDLMRLWRDEMETFEHDGDHNSFMAAYRKVEHAHQERMKQGRESADWRNPMRPGELKYFSEPHSSATMFEKFFEVEKMSVNCFNHISKARCSTYGRTQVQRFVQLFKLRTYMVQEAHDVHTLYYPYCVYPLIQPLLYGWFPVKYIPFCPKFEKFG